MKFFRSFWVCCFVASLLAFTVAGATGAQNHANNHVAMHNGVRFRLQSCRHASGELVCEVELTTLNPGEYRALWYAQKSYLVDQFGKRVAASDLRIDKLAPPDAEIDLPGFRYVMTLTFNGIAPEVVKVSELEINGNDGSPVTLRYSSIPAVAK